MCECDHSDLSAHVYQHNFKVGDKINFENLKILDRASNYGMIKGNALDQKYNHCLKIFPDIPSLLF